MNRPRAWVDIHLDRLNHNVQQINALISKKTKIMAVVKADAYGHGLEQITLSLHQAGVTSFAVATLEEAIEVRGLLPFADILILGFTPVQNVYQLARHRLIQTVFSEWYVKLLASAACSARVMIKVEIKVDTGMNRIGFAYDQTNVIKELFSYKDLRVNGIYSHLSVADSFKPEDLAYTQVQINRYELCLKELDGFSYGRTHLQNSAGIINQSHLQFDYVRPGIMLFGIPSGEVKEVDLKPILELKASISMIKIVKAEEYVGYGRIVNFNEPRKIATVSIGYADGYPRSLSGKAVPVLVNGQYARIIGSVCMDQLMIDVTNIVGVSEEDQVVLIGTSQTKKIMMSTIAEKAHTITNDLACQFSLRTVRLYTSSNEKDVETLV
ncbi:alanine racemase [Alkalicoccobacillus plakortidis]|uniref:Alanine racemase n=1 Tax=Alkalicoccobacillus plakortidis TaxID=444060 RepID=A0ABT0XRA7_9BACI|nr:alanine racemase [Alkalicoccobacillus plakortidis]MCM2677908.1 alanine racemase [Alkalicoccobacillus plakortidis]